MFKNLLLFSILGIMGFFAWKHFTTKPSPPTPVQQVSAFVSQSVLPATELASLCEKYPRLVTEALKGKRVVVSGVLEKSMVIGVNSNDLKLELIGVPKLKISFQSDFGQQERWGAQSKFRFEKRGKEIWVGEIAKPGDGNMQSGRKSPAALCREGDTLTMRGEFRNIAPGWVKCDLLELP